MPRGVLAHGRLELLRQHGRHGQRGGVGNAYGVGPNSRRKVESATVGAEGTVIGVGHTLPGQGSQQVFLEAGQAGTVRAVRLAAISGGVVPELAINDLATADGEQIAVGSADGYPAVWRQGAGSSTWSPASSLPVVSGYSGLSALTSVTHGPAGWLALGKPGPVVLTSSDGTTWRRAGGSIAQDLTGATAVMTAASQSGAPASRTLRSGPPPPGRPGPRPRSAASAVAGRTRSWHWSHPARR